MPSFRLGIDLMGADIAPLSIFEAVRSFTPESSLHFFATDEIIKLLPASVHALSCPEVIGMEEEGVHAVKTKKASSLVRAIIALKEGKIDALLSCANTGALVAAASLFLKRIPSVSKPALITLFPARDKQVVLLDVGAAISSTAVRLQELAQMGSAFAYCVQSIEMPTVALLNIGAESQKGDPELKKAWKALTDAKEPFRFVGNLEPEAVFEAKADVFVTSGFVGNLFLKTAEATANFISESRLKTKSQGALLVGVLGLVMKCHGASSPEAILQAAHFAKKLHDTHFLKRTMELFP